MRSLRHPLGSTAGASPGRSQRRAAAPPSASAAQPHRRAPRPPHARSTGDASRPPSASRAAAVAPVAEERAASARTAGSPPPQPPAALPGAGLLTASLDAIAAPVRGDLEALNANLLVRVGAKHATLAAAAQRIFGAGGKKLRPTLCFLVARATAQAAGLRRAPPLRRRAFSVVLAHTPRMCRGAATSRRSTARWRR